MATLSKLRSMTPSDKNTLKYKDNPNKPIITHCSYCFKDMEEYRNKIRSYGHQEYNKPPFGYLKVIVVEKELNFICVELRNLIIIGQI